MTAALTPQRALDHLLGLTTDVRDGVVLAADGRRLAGSAVLAGPARELLAASEAPEIEVGTGRGGVFASRSERGAIVVATHRSALPALMLYDLRVTLERLEGGR
jgi:hypothetical protein